jgi:pyruvate/2-oxoglutarate dehydrogenase complex dihydrolipoamide acyltransferase (E2) component
VVEVLCGNVTVDVPANISGRLFEKKVDVDAVARPGEVLGVIERY